MTLQDWGVPESPLPSILELRQPPDPGAPPIMLCTSRWAAGALARPENPDFSFGHRVSTWRHGRFGSRAPQ